MPTTEAANLFENKWLRYRWRDNNPIQIRFDGINYSINRIILPKQN